MNISQRVKEKRNEKNWTQTQLAETIAVSKRTISNWETGKTTPDIESLVQLAKLFDWSLDELLLEDPKVVKELKKKEELANLTQMYWLGPLATQVVLIFLLYLPVESHSNCLLILVSVANCTNLATMLYFNFKIAHLKGQDDKFKQKMNRLKTFFVLFTLCLLLFLFYLFIV